MEKQLPKRAWLIVALLCVVGLLNYLDRTMIATMRNSIVDSIPMTDAQFGLLTSVFLWVYGLLSPFTGFLADKFSKSKVILISLFVWSFVTWLTSQATTYNQLLATRALMGISEACYIPAALALIMDYHTGYTRSLATGLHLSGVMVGQSLGFIGGMLAESHSWTYAFKLLGIIGIAYAVLIMFILKDAPVEQTQTEETGEDKEEDKVAFGAALKNLFTNSSFISLFVFWGVLGIVGWLITAWLPVFYQEQFNLPQGKAGLYATAYLHPASIVGLLLGGFLTDRWSRKNKYAKILMPIIGLAITAPAVFIGGTTSILAVAIICFMLYGFSRNFVDTNLMPVLCMVADNRYRATGYGLMNMFATVIGGIGIYVAGVLKDSDINLNTVYGTAAISVGLCIFLLILVLRNVKKNGINN